MQFICLSVRCEFSYSGFVTKQWITMRYLYFRRPKPQASVCNSPAKQRSWKNRLKRVCKAKVISTYSAIVHEDSGLELVWRAGVNDHPITGLDSYGSGDVIKLFVIPSDGIFTVVSDVLTCTVAQQSKEWELTWKFHIPLNLETAKLETTGYLK